MSRLTALLFENGFNEQIKRSTRNLHAIKIMLLLAKFFLGRLVILKYYRKKLNIEYNTQFRLKISEK